jgi:hypothetical protein
MTQHIWWWRGILKWMFDFCGFCEMWNWPTRNVTSKQTVRILDWFLKFWKLCNHCSIAIHHILNPIPHDVKCVFNSFGIDSSNAFRYHLHTFAVSHTKLKSIQCILVLNLYWHCCTVSACKIDLKLKYWIDRTQNQCANACSVSCPWKFELDLCASETRALRIRVKFTFTTPIAIETILTFENI